MPFMVELFVGAADAPAEPAAPLPAFAPAAPPAGVLGVVMPVVLGAAAPAALAVVVLGLAVPLSLLLGRGIEVMLVPLAGAEAAGCVALVLAGVSVWVAASAGFFASPQPNRDVTATNTRAELNRVADIRHPAFHRRRIRGRARIGASNQRC
jgi:hypothetical protein